MKNAFSIISIIGILFGLVILNLCFLKLSKAIIDDTQTKLIANVGAEATGVSFVAESKLEQNQKFADLAGVYTGNVDLRRHHDSNEFEDDHRQHHNSPLVNNTYASGNNTDVPIIPPRPMTPAEDPNINKEKLSIEDKKSIVEKLETSKVEYKVTFPENIGTYDNQEMPTLDHTQSSVDNAVLKKNKGLSVLAEKSETLKENPILENKQVTLENKVNPIVDNKVVSIEAKEIAENKQIETQTPIVEILDNPPENKQVKTQTPIVENKAVETKNIPLAENTQVSVENKEILENKPIIENIEAATTLKEITSEELPTKAVEAAKVVSIEKTPE
jgi:hypothetical protein